MVTLVSYENSAEDLFKISNSIINRLGYNYWICDGTLLGVIRDNKILSWDHDIDFAVWKDEVNIDFIVKAFTEAGFQQENVFGNDCLHFIGGNKKIDISLFSRDNKSFYAKFLFVKEFDVINKMLYVLTRTLCFDTKIEDIKRRFNFKRAKSYIIFPIELLLIYLKWMIPNSIKSKVLSYSLKKFNYVFARFPIELMNFKCIKFLDENVVVPVESEKYLEIAYGKDWKIPKKNYDWTTEATNLTM